MTHEPHEIITVPHRPIIGADKPRTLAEYQVPIIARFGCLPPWPVLAKTEGTGRAFGGPTSFSEEGLAAIRAVREKEGEPTNRIMLAALERGPATTRDIATATGKAESVARHALIRLRDRGKVKCVKLKRCAVWSLAVAA